MTFSEDFGKQIEHWNGMDLTMNARLASGLVQGGLSTGARRTDDCELDRSWTIRASSTATSTRTSSLR